MSPIKPASAAKPSSSTLLQKRRRRCRAGRAAPARRRSRRRSPPPTYDTVEKIWLEHFKKSPDDLEWFENVAKAVAKVDADTAAVLVEGQIDEYKKAGKWKQRLDVLHRHGRLIFKKPQELHNAALEALRKHYADKPSLESLIDRVGLTKAVEDVPKNWAKIEKLESLLAFDVGAVVYMDGKGVGKVQEVNLALESFKVFFEAQPRAAGRLQRRAQADEAAAGRPHPAAQDGGAGRAQAARGRGSQRGAARGAALRGPAAGRLGRQEAAPGRGHRSPVEHLLERRPQTPAGDQRQRQEDLPVGQQHRPRPRLGVGQLRRGRPGHPGHPAAPRRRAGSRPQETDGGPACRGGERTLQDRARPGRSRFSSNLERAGLPPGQVPFSPDRLVVEQKDLRVDLHRHQRAQPARKGLPAGHATAAATGPSC